MSKIIISTESGSDLPYKITVPHNIEVVPLHVNFGRSTLNDGEFGIDEIYKYFDNNKELPTTSAVNPGEYIKHFKRIFDSYADCKIIHISYSSKLSVTYQNAVIASNSFDTDKICIIDSLNASAGAGAVVMLAAKIVEKFKDKLTFDEYVSIINRYRKQVCCAFVTDKLDYMKAEGRISGVKYMGAAVLNLKPSIYLSDGELAAGKKYRGNISRVAGEFLNDFVNANNLSRDFIIIGYSHGISSKLLFELKRKAHKMGFVKSWCFELGSAVTCHTGPDCLGFAGETAR
ncbi:MAG: DegV family protein [Clostridiales bacterium]|nr:DegV family protein [Clostridiales bacterium]